MDKLINNFPYSFPWFRRCKDEPQREGSSLIYYVITLFFNLNRLVNLMTSLKTTLRIIKTKNK